MTLVLVTAAIRGKIAGFFFKFHLKQNCFESERLKWSWAWNASLCVLVDHSTTQWNMTDFLLFIWYKRDLCRKPVIVYTMYISNRGVKFMLHKQKVNLKWLVLLLKSVFFWRTGKTRTLICLDKYEYMPTLS